MATELRKTGISVIGDVHWGTHFCHFYETKQDLLDTLVPYFKAGLESKEYCLWVVSDSEMITVEEAKGVLAQAVPDLDRHLADENIEILNGHDWYFEKNVLNLERVASAWDAKVKRALARGYEGLRASADTFWLREKDWKDFCAYEKQVDDWIADQRMTVLCTYPLAKSGAAEVLDVAQTHRFAIARRRGEWEVFESLELIQARAEIKRLNEALQRVVEQTPEPSAILSYGVAVLSVIAALIITLWLRSEVGQSSTPIVGLFLCAVMFSAWFSGVGPGLLATALSLLAFVYYFAAPFYSWAVDIKEIPRLIIFALSALFVGSLSAAQRSKAESLRRARDVLDETVQEVKRTNVALRAEITERKRAEALLHAQEQVFRAIVENAPDHIARYDRSFQRTYVNPSFAKALELPAEALIGMPIFSNLRDAGADVKEDELAQIRQRCENVFDTGESCEFEVTLPMPTARRYYSVRFFPELDLNGSVINVLAIARDITKRKRAEDALRQSEDRIRLIIDTIPVMAWSLRPDGVVDFLNQRWIDYAGLSLEQYLEEPTRPVHPEDIPRVMEKWLADMGAGEPNEDEIRLRRADGEYRWFLVRNAPLRDEQGNVVEWYGASIDIQERKQVEEQLRQSERQLAEAQRLARVGSWNWDLQNNVLSWSDELYRVSGVDPQAFTPAYEEFVMEFVHAEDRALVRGVIESSLKTQEPFSFYYRILRPDGEERVIYSRGGIVSDEHGKPVRMFGAAQDVTEHRRAEEALREAERKYHDIFEHAGEGIFQSTPDGRYIAANPALARMYGFASPEELIHSRRDISLQLYVDPTRREEFKRQLEEQGVVRGFEHEVFRKDGSRLWISVNARVVKDEQGAIQYYEGTAQDMTERKAAEERLRATTEQLRALSARVHSAKEEEGTRIAREIHDELGTALTSLRWDLESVDKVISESGDEPQLQALRERIEAMLRLIETTISSVRRISSELRPSVLDDLGLVEAIEWQAEQFQARTGIICRCDCALENLGFSQERSTALFRIFQEALTNILRHAQATCVDITIKAEAGEFVLIIMDNGRGITENEKSGSQSLGLLGMQERAHLIGGKINISGVKGEGTVITVRVPRPG
jgi:PAS domain S-box-containing protein